MQPPQTLTNTADHLQRRSAAFYTRAVKSDATDPKRPTLENRIS